MPDYRLYLLNAHSGHIDGVEEFRSADHEEAIGSVERSGRAAATELWCGARKIARFDARPKAEAPER